VDSSAWTVKNLLRLIGEFIANGQKISITTRCSRAPSFITSRSQKAPFPPTQGVISEISTHDYSQNFSLNSVDKSLPAPGLTSFFLRGLTRYHSVMISIVRSTHFIARQAGRTNRRGQDRKNSGCLTVLLPTSSYWGIWPSHCLQSPLLVGLDPLYRRYCVPRSSRHPKSNLCAI
jgi:hypothetical protein